MLFACFTDLSSGTRSINSLDNSDITLRVATPSLSEADSLLADKTTQDVTLSTSTSAIRQIPTKHYPKDSHSKQKTSIHPPPGIKPSSEISIVE